MSGQEDGDPRSAEGQHDFGLVSVVIPAFNAEQYVATAVRSVLDQTYGNVEVVVIDDGSTDDTAAAARSAADHRVRVISRQNQGLASSRNEGLAMTSGPWVAFLDADDFWLPHKLEAQLEALRREPDLVAVGCLARYTSDSGRTLGVAGVPLGPGDHRLVAEGRLSPFPCSFTLFRREPLTAIGGFDESLATHIPGLVEDLDVLSKLAGQAAIGCVPEVLVSYRVHSGSASANHYFSQRKGIRFITAKRKAESRGETLTWDDFCSAHRTSPWQLRQDVGAYSYRRAGLSAANGRWFGAFAHAAVAGALSPLYVLKKLRRQLNHPSHAGLKVGSP